MSISDILDTDTATLFEFDRPFEQDNENVISKLFQRVRSSFGTSSSSSSISSVSVLSNATNSSKNLENGSLNSPPQTPNFKPSKASIPDKENKGLEPAPSVVSLESTSGNNPSESDISGQEHTNINGNGNNNAMAGNSINSQHNQTNGVYDPGHSLQYRAKDVSDTRSIRSVQSTASVGNGYSISRAIRRLRGEGVNKDYWMADNTCRECYDCKVTFTMLRRKHHCRICGQIFCSKCASNLIPGGNFSHEGLMRVCNFCLKLMKEYDFEVDNGQEMSEKNEFNIQRRIHTLSSLSNNHDIIPTNIVTPELQNSYGQLQNLPPRAPSPDRLSLNDSIKKMDGIKKMFSVASSSLFMTRSRSNTITAEENATSSPAPFRRSLTEEDKVTPAVNPEAILDPEIAPFMSDEEDDGHYDFSSNFLTFNSHANCESATPTPAVSEYAGSDDESEYSVKTPYGIKTLQNGQRAEDIRNHFAKSSSSRRRSITSGRPTRSNKRGFGLFRQMLPIDAPLAPSPIEQRPSSPFRARHARSSSVPIKPEINPAFFDHMRRLLRQSLLESKINLSDGWEDVIMKLMMKVSDSLNPNIRNGDEIDIRHYVKIKKIPGGVPQDSEYVHGVVCTKNLAHKRMKRTLNNPRVLILTFALEYHRVENQLMSLQPVMDQEEQYLKILVDRIVALSPHLVLVEKTVARLALQFLLEKNIAVALNVKSSVIEAVARCTRADIIPSIDKLAVEPKLGKCGTFSVKTFVHQLIPSRRRTYLFFENCPRELGCTIVLRGGDVSTIEKIKRITDLMVFVVYNLKLETALIANQFAKTPSIISEDKVIDYEKKPEIMTDKSINAQTTDDIMRPYETTILSVSPFIQFPAPYLLIRMKQAERRLIELRQKRIGWPSGSFKDGEKSSSSAVVSGILRTPEQVCADGELEEAINEHENQKRAWDNYGYNKLVSPYAHQNITVLSSKFCKVTVEIPCFGPDTWVMEYYRESDRTLGQYIEEVCSRSNYLCRKCDRPLIMHHHSFCHGNARITVAIEKYNCPLSNPENKIIMWSYCKKCEKPTPITHMSEDTWKFSFGKYLELSFYLTELKSRIENCSHSIFQDHLWYFGYNNLAVKFEYEPIELLEVYVPPMQLYTKPEVHIKLKNHDLDTIRHKITDYWDSVTDRIKSFNYDIVQTDKVEGCKQDLLEMSRRVVTEKRNMLTKLQQTYVNSTPDDTLALNNVMFALKEKVLIWDKDFNDIARQYFPRLTARQLRRFFGDNPDAITLGRAYSGSPLNDLPLINMDPDDGSAARIDEFPAILPKLGSSPTADAILNELKDNIEFCEIELEKDIENASQMSLFPFMDPKVSRRLSMKWMKESKEGQKPKSRTASIFTTIMDNKEESTSDFNPEEIPRLIPSTIKHKKTTLPSSIPSFENQSESGIQSNYRPSIRSSSSHRDRLQFVLEKEREKESRLPSKLERPPSKRIQSRKNQNTNVSRISRKLTVPKLVVTPTENINSVMKAHENKSRKLSSPHKLKRRSKILSAKPTIEVFNDVEATAEESDEEFEESEENDYEGEIRIFSLNSTDAFDESLGNEENFPISSRESPNEIDLSALTFLGQDFNEPTPVTENFPDPSIPPPFPTIGGAMRTLSNFWADKKNLKPLDYPLNSTEHVFPDSPIIVREDEPSSIIAFALRSDEYTEELKTMQQSSHNSEVFMPEDVGTIKSSNWAVLEPEEGGDVEDSPIISHMKYQFLGDSTQFFCKIFCAEQFDTLRRNCGCESTYIQSLARCVKWDSSGGKSGSAFLKTRDDRLVMKQMSRNEVDAFLKFAPKYFEYMSRALVHLPTVLAKIFGFYRIGFRNEHSGKSMKIDVIVMENLFYERKVSKIFDLKGSMRNRHVQSTGKQNEVLLDENLLELMNENPLYLREHSKKLLTESLFNDTLFLARHNVMDYSLLVGFDEEKRELVIGIVDFIRTFTLDKRLESLIKETGFLGGGGKEPTIVSPSQYKKRFREAMDRYFLMVPDRWIAYQARRKAPAIL